MRNHSGANHVQIDVKKTRLKVLVNPPIRYGIIDLRELSLLCGFSEVTEFQLAHCRWVNDSLAREAMAREGRWSEAIAVGNLNFVEKMQNELGYKAAHRQVIESGGTYELREQTESYGPNFSGQNEVLRSENTRFWSENSELTAT